MRLNISYPLPICWPSFYLLTIEYWLCTDHLSIFWPLNIGYVLTIFHKVFKLVAPGTKALLVISFTFLFPMFLHTIHTTQINSTSVSEKIQCWVKKKMFDARNKFYQKCQYSSSDCHFIIEIVRSSNKLRARELTLWPILSSLLFDMVNT